ncbi:MAG: endonuclease/exonuclease/phosphatase family protein [Candidatus Saccharimonadales bacterium]
MTIISLNVAGMPLPRYTHARLREFCRQTERLDADVLNLQEVNTYAQLLTLRRHLPSFPYVAFKLSIIGPRAGLVTFSKTPFRNTSFFPLFLATRRFGNAATLESLRKGALAIQFDSTLVINIHLNPNKDGDWSNGNRFYPIHIAQLEAFSQFFSRYKDVPLIMSGDFNLAKDCDLYKQFLEANALIDAFGEDNTPTFHSEYLRPDRKPHRIDHLLIRHAKAVQNDHLFRDRVRLSNSRRSFISDHVGLLGKIKF